MSPKPRSAPTVVDLFAGAGGLSGGLERAGFHSLAVVDNDPTAVETLKATRDSAVTVPGSDRTYLEGSNVVLGDIRELTAGDLIGTAKGRRKKLDLVAGGPPCQPFSSAGKQRGLADPRGSLFRDFVRIVDELDPKYVLFENVRGLLTAKGPSGRSGEALSIIQTCFEEIGYACKFAILNSADHGAAQRRVRLFMFGVKGRSLPDFPRQTHAKQGRTGDLFAPEPWLGLGAALKRMARPPLEELVFPSGSRESALRALLPGTGLKSGGIVESNRPSGHWGYRQDSFLADCDLPARTIRTATTPDWILDEEHGLRRLHWTECAQLQGFDPRWQFRGTVAAKFRQIGNAVEGTTAEALGLAVRSALSRRAKASASEPWPDYFKQRIQYTEMEERVNGRVRAATRASA